MAKKQANRGKSLGTEPGFGIAVDKGSQEATSIAASFFRHPDDDEIDLFMARWHTA